MATYDRNPNLRESPYSSYAFLLVTAGRLTWRLAQNQVLMPPIKGEPIALYNLEHVALCAHFLSVTGPVSIVPFSQQRDSPDPSVSLKMNPLENETDDV